MMVDERHKLVSNVAATELIGVDWHEAQLK